MQRNATSCERGDRGMVDNQDPLTFAFISQDVGGSVFREGVGPECM